MYGLTANTIEGLCYWQGKNSEVCTRSKPKNIKFKVNGGSSLRALHLRIRRGQLNLSIKNNILTNMKTTGFVALHDRVCRIVINQWVTVSYDQILSNV